MSKIKMVFSDSQKIKTMQLQEPECMATIKVYLLPATKRHIPWH